MSTRREEPLDARRGVAEYESNAGGLDVVSANWDDNQVALYPAARRKPRQEAFQNRSRRTGRIPQVRDGLRPPNARAHALPGAHLCGNHH